MACATTQAPDARYDYGMNKPPPYKPNWSMDRIYLSNMGAEKGRSQRDELEIRIGTGILKLGQSNGGNCSFHWKASGRLPLTKLIKALDHVRPDSEKAMASKNVLPNPVDLSSVPTAVLLKAARDRNRQLKREHGPYAAQKKLSLCPRGCGNVFGVREMRRHLKRKCSPKISH
jgi:hypothetical protein